MAAILSIALPVCTAADDVTLGPPQIGEWDPIEMPDPHKPPALTDDTSSTSTEENGGSGSNLLIPLVMIVGSAIAAAAVLIYSYWQGKFDPKSPSTATAKTPAAAKTSYCTECGSTLPEESKFCWSCGDKAKRP